MRRFRFGLSLKIQEGNGQLEVNKLSWLVCWLSVCNADVVFTVLSVFFVRLVFIHYIAVKPKSDVTIDFLPVLSWGL